MVIRKQRSCRCRFVLSPASRHGRAVPELILPGSALALCNPASIRRGSGVRSSRVQQSLLSSSIYPCVKRSVANAKANLPRRRYPRAIGKNGSFKSEYAQDLLLHSLFGNRSRSRDLERSVAVDVLSMRKCQAIKKIRSYPYVFLRPLEVRPSGFYRLPSSGNRPRRSPCEEP